MNHNDIDTGILRAYLDGEAGAATEHISACDTCQAELKELQGRAANVGAAFDELPNPAATNTCPLGSKVAVWPSRVVVRVAAAIQFRVSGSYNSALSRSAMVSKSLKPAMASTLPLGSRVAL